MRLEKRILNIFGENYKAEIQIFEDKDRKVLKEIWELWIRLKELIHNFGSRSMNLPEILSESAWCLYSGSVRLIKPTSTDTYNIDKQEAEQIKASIINEDLTSFGPKSRWDKLYFLDFSKLNGSFDAYEIPTDILYSQVLNKKKMETFRDQQIQGRRPRLSLKKLINAYDIKPIERNIKVW